MRTGSRHLRPLVGLILTVLVTLVQAGPGEAASPRRQRPSPPPPGWLLDIARIEPLSPSGFLSIDGLGDYRGVMELRRSTAGVAVVNDVALEDYLRGIAEMPSGWPAEALRAQGVAARTYAVWQIRAGPSAQTAALGAQICATEGCQVYAGLAKERQEHGGAWVAAVESTRGQVLLYQGAPIVAKYSSSNGGRSVSGGKPYLRPVADPDDARSPLSRWALALPYTDVGRALATPAPVTAVRQAGGAVVAAWTAADGVTGQTTVPISDFRSKVNAVVAPPPGRARTLPSAQLALRPDDGAGVATLEGRGYGHGIGMSQFGALGKALRGMKASAILAAYYGGIRPTALPPGKLPARVRVVLDPGRPAWVVRGSGPFRVLDGKGRVVAEAGTGTWQIVPGARGGVRVVPPRGQGPKPAVPAAAKPEQRFPYRALLAVADPDRRSASASSI
jgi:stage II sporulation protein D (peptidoglycan lytic transglycosylase)